MPEVCEGGRGTIAFAPSSCAQTTRMAAFAASAPKSAEPVPTSLETVYTFELFEGRTLTAILFDGVSNSAALRKQLLAQSLDAALINPDSVAGTLHLRIAANKALLNEATREGGLATNSLHAELVYSLSASRNISAAFRAFGIADASTRVLLCVFDAGRPKAHAAGGGGGDGSANNNLTADGMRALVAGTPVDIGALNVDAAATAKVAHLRKLFKVGDLELACRAGSAAACGGALQAAIVSKVAARDV